MTWIDSLLTLILDAFFDRQKRCNARGCMTDEERIRQLEAEGLTHSDAVAALGAEKLAHDLNTRAWDDQKAAAVARAVKLLQPCWDTDAEWQARVSVYPKPSEMEFWFGDGDAPNQLYATVYKNAQASAQGEVEVESADTHVDPNTADVPTLAAAIVQAVERRLALQTGTQ